MLASAIVLAAAGAAGASNGAGHGAWPGPEPGAATSAASGDWLLAASQNGRELALLECSNGRELGRTSLDSPLSAPPLHSGERVWLLGADRRLRVLTLPAMREIASRPGMPPEAKLAVSDLRAGLVAVGGKGPDALLVLDSATLADVHAYRFETPITVAAIAHAADRASFLVGLLEPASPAEVWELAHAADAPPVLKGLVHDYRMNEAVPLPGRFTPRVAPVDSPTMALLPGPVPYEWLRIDSAGAASVLHLEVRREIARLPGKGDWLVAAWRGGGRRGWLLGLRDSEEFGRLESTSWRLDGPHRLPGRLLAMLAFGDLRAAALALAVEGGTVLVRVEADTLAITKRRNVAGSGAGARLVASFDGRCIAMLDAAGRWLDGLRIGQ